MNATGQTEGIKGNMYNKPFPQYDRDPLFSEKNYEMA